METIWGVLISLTSNHLIMCICIYMCICDRRAKRGREEPPHVRGHGQKLGGPKARRLAAKRSYPKSEVRSSGQEYRTATAQERPRGDTQHPRSGWRGEELPCVWGQGRRVGGATPCPHAQGQGHGREEQPHVQRALAVRTQEGLEELSYIEGQEGRQWGDNPHPR